MKIILFAATFTLLVSCQQTVVTHTTEIKEVQLSQLDKDLVLDAVRKFDGTTSVSRILLIESWGKEDNSAIYRIVLNDPGTSKKPKAYRISKSKGKWHVLSTTF